MPFFFTSIGKLIFPKAIFRIPNSSNEVYLTFDDGPTPEVTDWVLECLERYSAKATFFCVGSQIERNPVLFKKLKTAGHQIGNHTYSHKNGWKTEYENYLTDVKKGNSLSKSTLFRPPYGKLNRKQYNSIKENHQVIMWDILSKDYDSRLTPQNITLRVVPKVRSGSIIVFHDSQKAYKNLRGSLPEILNQLSKKGFKFSVFKN